MSLRLSPTALSALAVSASFLLLACADDDGDATPPTEAPDAGAELDAAPSDDDAAASDAEADASDASSTGSDALPDPDTIADEDPFASPGGEISGFRQPILVCSDPLPGEPPGQSDGKVCTWSLISACTEEGRRDLLPLRPHRRGRAPDPMPRPLRSALTPPPSHRAHGRAPTALPYPSFQPASGSPDSAR